MILDDHDDLEPTDEIVDEEDEDLDDDEWLGGLRRAGLPVRSTTDRPATPSTSPAVRRLVTESWAPTASAGVVELVERSLGESTRAAYERDWLEFATWCEVVRGLDDPLMAGEVDVAEYVAELTRARLAVATIRRRLSAIAFAFELVRRPAPSQSPLVRRTLEGAKRTLGTAQRRAAPLRLADMLRITLGVPITDATRPAMRRDQLLVALGWAAALRPDELVGLDVEDLHFVGDPDVGDGGVLVRVRRSKTDQTAAVEWVAVPYASQWSWCPVRVALRYTRQHRQGPLFRHIDRHGKIHRRLGPNAVGRILKPYVAELLEQDPAAYSGHSLRAGFVTSARDAGIADEVIARQTRHRHRGKSNILDVYDRPTDLFARCPLTPEWW